MPAHRALLLVGVAAQCALPYAWTPAVGAAHSAAAAACRCSGAVRCKEVVAAPPASAEQQQKERIDAVTPVPLSWWVAVRGAFKSKSFTEFMQFLRREQGESIKLDLWPVLPPTYVVMGKTANRGVLSELDPSLEQILQELINLLPVSARIPSEVDVELQKKVASLFQSVQTVNARLPSFVAIAERMKSRWLAMPADEPLNIFFELSEFVLRADLEIL